jgi:integral membrane protein (TIGR01906 family)
MRQAGARAASAIVGLAIVLVIANVAILPLLTPAWVLAGQQLTGAGASSGFTDDELATIDAALLGDLILGPPDFDVEVGGAPVLVERERGHLRDVRTAFLGFFGLGIASLAVVAVAALRARGDRLGLWRLARRAGLVLVGVVAVAGVVTAVAFEVAFEAFHRLLFPPGSYTFDPATDRLVQIFPFQFWTLSSIAAGALIAALALALAIVAGRRLRAERATGSAAVDPAAPANLDGTPA